MKFGFKTIRTIAILSCLMIIPTTLTYVFYKLGIGDVSLSNAYGITLFGFVALIIGMGVVINIANNEIRKIDSLPSKCRGLSK